MWCRWCGGKVKVAAGGGSLARAEHEDGGERCADGRHVAAPVEFQLAGWS